jgi:hypothetical protein
MPFCKKCNGEFPNRIKIDNQMKNLSSRQYCLTCSPFGKHNTKKIEKVDEFEKRCPRCETTKSVEEFYQRRGKVGGSVYCKSCTTNQTVERQRKFKQLCVDYKGSSCSGCGYNKCIGALEFHHTNPKEKDFTIANARLTAFDDKVKKELDKCILLCSNCHREEHERVRLNL